MNSSLPGSGVPQPRLRLVEARVQRDWSQQDVADRIGTTHVNVSRWERGITKPNPYFRRKLCRLFGLTEIELDLEGPPRDGTPAANSHGPAPDDVVSESHEDESVTAPAHENAIYDAAIPLKPAVGLIGRSDELARIKRRLFSGANVTLTALNGLPGVGKTSLAVTLAHDPEVRAHFRDGVLWAALGPQPNMPGLLSRWGTLLGVPAPEMANLSDTAAWAQALHAAIGSRRFLLVIDDAWTVEDALTLKIGGSNCAHLMTTRFPYIATQAAFEGATVIHELNDEDSIALLRLLAPGVVESEDAKAHELIHAVGGLPLALTLMGNYLRKESHSGQARRINAALLRLNDAEARLQISEPRGPVESHSSLPGEATLSLHSVIAVSDQMLAPSARAALYALSVFPPKPASFSEEAALVVAACNYEDLDALSDAGLLESSGDARYTLHQVIADYARSHLRALPGAEAHRPYDRLIDYAADYVEANRTGYELLELESSVILAALKAAQNLGRHRALVRGVTAFAPFLLVRASYQLARPLLESARSAAETLGDSHGLTSVLLYLGQIALRLGDYSQAESHYQAGLTLARALQDPERISALLTDLGTVAWKRGEYAQAETYLQEGLELARQIGHEERICGLLETLGSVAIRQGNYAEAEAYLQEGLELARQVGDREQICTLLISLGGAACEQGNFTEAEESFQEGLVLARQIGHREWVSLLLNNLGDIANAQKNYVEAEKFFLEGLHLARQIDQREWIGLLLLNLGLATWKQGNCAQAESYFQEGLTMARQIGIPQITCSGLYEYGNFCLDQHRLENAKNIFDEMLTTAPEGGQDSFALAQYGLARIAASRKDFQEARKLGVESAKILEEIGHRDAREVRNWLNSLAE